MIETIEKLFYDYVDKAEGWFFNEQFVKIFYVPTCSKGFILFYFIFVFLEWNSKFVFSSQANLSRLKTQILHEADRRYVHFFYRDCFSYSS